MISLSLPDSSLIAAAEARGQSFVFRALTNAVFAIGVALMASSLLLPSLCLALIVVLSFADVWAGRFFSKRPLPREPWMKSLVVASVIATISACMALGVVAAVNGGREGQLAAVLIAASSLVTVIVLIVDAPFFMALCAAPAFILLASLLFIDEAPSSGSNLAGVVGLFLCLAAFSCSLFRAALQHIDVFGKVKAARDEAEERRKEAEAGWTSAEKASRAKSDFLYAITHELRTPLSIVINYAEAIEEESDGHLAKDAAKIKSSARHLLGLIDRVLDFVQINAGDLTLRPEEFRVAEVVDAALAQHRELIESSGNSLQLVTERSSLSIVSDRGRFQQCVEALVSNACRFTQNGHVQIKTRTEGEFVSLVVADTGPGLSRDAIEAIFSPFTKLDASNARGREGLGLGLSTAIALARAMGGDIFVQSAIDQGSLFELRLPLRAAAER